MPNLSCPWADALYMKYWPMKILVIVCAFFLLSLSGCSKSGSGANSDNVYVAGAILNGARPEAKSWKNESLTALSDSISYATAIVVSGNDVYVGGYETTDGISKSKYWKNGSPILLTDGTDSGYRAAPNGYFPRTIDVSGSDIYVAGYSRYGNKTVAKYWKNGIATILGDSASYGICMAVSGSDVYVLGYENGVAVYWANGIPFTVESGSPNPAVAAIAVSGSDVYVAGNSFGPMYWKNQTPIFLVDSFSTANTSAIAASGSDVYVAGYGQDANGTLYAMYWKNGTAVTLGKGQGFSIAVSGSDVYVAGYSGPEAVYWKNGKLVSLGERAQAYSIFVTKN
jgi:hypothetical protein